MDIRIETNVLIRGEVSYQSDLNKPGSVMKKGKTLKDLVIDEVPRGVIVKPAKINDVKNYSSVTLVINGLKIHQLSIYVKNVLSTYGEAAGGGNGDEDEEPYCFQEEGGVEVIV